MRWFGACHRFESRPRPSIQVPATRRRTALALGLRPRPGYVNGQPWKARELRLLGKMSDDELAARADGIGGAGAAAESQNTDRQGPAERGVMCAMLTGHHRDLTSLFYPPSLTARTASSGLSVRRPST